MKFEVGKMGGVPAYWCRYRSDENSNSDRVELCLHASAAEIRAWAGQDLPKNGRILKKVIEAYFEGRVKKELGAATVRGVRPDRR